MLAAIANLFLGGLNKTLGAVLSIDPNLRAPIAIALGAVPGALSRYYITIFAARWLGTAFPFGTLFINLTGAFVMGFFITFTLERAIASPDLRLLIAVGFLGSYTTFSTYALDTAALLRNSNLNSTLFYWAGSAVLGFVCLELGSLLAKRFGA
jgi:CrcB protein